MQLKQYATDRTLEEEGRVIQLGEGSWIKIARMNNRRMIEFMRKRTAPYGHRLDRMSNEERERLTMEAVCATVVLDWAGMMDGDKEIPHSPENVKDVFTRYPDFFREVIEIAKEYQTFREADREEDAGNSRADSEPN
jgi:hypothetical protein